MTPDRAAANSVKSPSLHCLAVAFLGLIIVFHLGSAWSNKAFLRASHLGTALEYARGRIDLLHPVIAGFNATGTPTAQELPLWQAAAAMAFKVAHSTWYGWANVVSLLLFATCLWPFFQLARHYTGDRVAWWATILFLAQPIIIIMAGEAAADGFCLVSTIWFLFFADKMIRTGSGWLLLPATAFACLAAVLKLPFFMAAGLGSLGLLFVNHVRAWRPWLLLAGAGALAMLALGLWSRHADALAAQAEFPYYELRFSQNPNLVQWYFGDLHSRLSPGLWLKGGWRFLHATLGSPPLIGLLLFGLLRPGNLMPKVWLLGGVLTTLVFTTGVLNHWHYFLMYCPAVALLCGSVLARWENSWFEEFPWPRLVLPIAGLVLALSAVEGLITMKISIDYDSFPRKISSLLREHTNPNDRLIVLGESTWGGEVLFRSGRKGLSVYSLEPPRAGPKQKGLAEILGSDEHLGRLKSLGYNKLVLLSESPVRFAVQAVNPGSQRQRLFYPETISKTVDSWPVVYRSEDILIREIP